MRKGTKQVINTGCFNIRKKEGLSLKVEYRKIAEVEIKKIIVIVKL